MGRLFETGSRDITELAVERKHHFRTITPHNPCISLGSCQKDQTSGERQRKHDVMYNIPEANTFCPFIRSATSQWK